MYFVELSVALALSLRHQVLKTLLSQRHLKERHSSLILPNILIKEVGKRGGCVKTVSLGEMRGASFQEGNTVCAHKTEMLGRGGALGLRLCLSGCAGFSASNGGQRQGAFSVNKT